MYRADSLALNTPLNLGVTLSSAQTFQWIRRGRGWLGVTGDSAVYLLQTQNTVLFKIYGGGEWDPVSYFRLDDDYPSIIKSLGFDPIVRRLINTQPGLRVTRQDPWECLLMFVLSTNNNYKRIVKMTLNLNRAFGKKVETEFGAIHLFPTVESLSVASLQELVGCGLGYRSKYVLELARTLREGGVDLSRLRSKPYEEVRSTLLGLPGVGPKVADCVSLFSLEKLESFPVDTWIRRVLAELYSHLLGENLHRVLKDESKSLSFSVYRAASQKMRSYFGVYAGYAQNQLYYHSKKLIKKGFTRGSKRKLSEGVP